MERRGFTLMVTDLLTILRTLAVLGSSPQTLVSLASDVIGWDRSTVSIEVAALVPILLNFFFSITDAALKEDRLCAQGKFFRLVKHLRVRPRAYTWILCGGSRITRKYLTCAKNMPGAKSLSYFTAASVTKKKGWLILVPCSGFFKDPPNPVDPGSIAGVGLVFILLKSFSLSL